jgi:hypothetical protein
VKKLLFPIAIAALLTAATSNCVDGSRAQVGSCPDPKHFRIVSSVLERRCGTLDCHGSTFRPLRIYGQQGLRRPEKMGTKNVDPADFAQYKTGGTVATTAAEIDDNFLSVCGIEPEIMDRVVAEEAEVSALTVVRKPRLTERHKGGRIWQEGQKGGDQCLTIWLTGGDPTLACNEELLKY